MEQHTQDAVSLEINVSPEIKVSPEPNASPERHTPRGCQRCRARRRDGKQCRLHAQDPATGLCSHHAVGAGDSPDGLQDSTDLSKQLLVVNNGGYSSAESINSILSNVVELLAKGRISPRRASVITFALSVMLRSVIVSDRKAANTPPKIIWDAPRPDRSGNKPAASTPSNGEANADAHKEASAKSRAQESYDATEMYSRLRT